MLIEEFSLVILGFLILLKSGDFLVDSSVAIARYFGLSELVIGMTIVAFGTSAPELMVNIQSSMNKLDAFVFGNVFGSNTINILIALGIGGLIAPIKLKTSTIRMETPFMLLITILLAVLLMDQWLFNGPNQLGTGDAIIMLILFAVFLIYNVRMTVYSKASLNVASKDAPASITKPIFIFLISCLGLHFGSDMIVSNAEFIGKELKVPDAIMGLTVLAIGTSLPEIVVVIQSVKKGIGDIAIGGMIGSNIFNILLILSVSSLIFPPTFTPDLWPDLIIVVVAAIELFALVILSKQKQIHRGGAILFLLSYVIYAVYRSQTL